MEKIFQAATPVIVTTPQVFGSPAMSESPAVSVMGSYWEWNSGAPITWNTGDTIDLNE